MAKQYLRKKQLADRYRTTERTIERMVEDGRIPKPDLYLGRFPLWDEGRLDESDRAWAAAPRPRRRSATTELTQQAT